MIDSAAVELLLPRVVACLILTTAPSGATSNQAGLPTLAGRWQVDFILVSPHRLQFDAHASGEGAFLSLDPISVTGSAPAPTTGTWILRGQSPAIYFFVIAGDVEFPTTNGRIEKGRLELSASSDLSLPINSLSGSGQFHSSSNPDDTRGLQDPRFTFTASRVSSLVVEILSPNLGGKLKRGKEARIEWSVLNTNPLASQRLFISLDGGDSFAVLNPPLPADVRSFDWTVPEDLKKTRRALIKVVVTDVRGASSEGISAQMFRIK